MDSVIHNGIKINLYKDKWTREYLNIDDDNCHWQYNHGLGYKRLKLNGAIIDTLLDKLEV